jgi:hypothetical protein
MVLLKKLTAALAVIAALLAAPATGCVGGSATEPPSQRAPAESPPATSPPAAITPAQTEEAAGPDTMAELIVDFSCGSDEENPQTYEFGYDGELTPEKLAEGLTNLTGLDFRAGFVRTEMGVEVTWAKDGTLIAGLGDREQLEAFYFFDVDSLRWFMLDSLHKTLVKNLGEENIYYAAEGGAELTFDELSLTQSFPLGIPFMGSAFYAQADEGGFILSAEEASEYLFEELKKAGVDTAETAVVEEPDGGDPWFGDMEVWYFAWGKNTAEKFTAESRFAVTYDWEIWEYDVVEDGWQRWN